MKSKIVNVWDQRRFGQVCFIVLQVEETDRELRKWNFNTGYKFIIQALYKQVGATGGHEFIPAYGTRTQDTSCKMNTVEGDVLGFYLSSVKDIYDIPDELYTENFWNIVYTDNKKEKKYDNDKYYKTLFCNHIKSFNERKKELNQLFEKDSSGRLNNLLESINAAMDDQEEKFKMLDTDFSTIFKGMKETLEKDEERFKRIGGNLDESYDKYSICFIDKETLEIIETTRYGTNDNEETIAEYNWLPNDVIPDNVLKEAKKKQEESELGDASFL